MLKDLFTSVDTVQDNEENINRKKVVRIIIICNLEFVIDKLFVIFFLQPQELDRAVINISQAYCELDHSLLTRQNTEKSFDDL